MFKDKYITCFIRSKFTTKNNTKIDIKIPKKIICSIINSKINYYYTTEKLQKVFKIINIFLFKIK